MYNTYKNAFGDIKDIEMQPYLANSKTKSLVKCNDFKRWMQSYTITNIMEALEKKI